jgi:dihydroorotate dehydrogenase (NAD+) catalytic subunit
MLGTTLGVGGFWNLPLTCQWLALSRAKVGAGNPLIATNGAQTGLDIARMMLAGASAVEMSSPVMIRGTQTLSGALAEFQNYLERKSLNAADLIGVAADRRRTFQAMPLKTGNWKSYVAS